MQECIDPARMAPQAGVLNRIDWMNEEGRGGDRSRRLGSRTCHLQMGFIGPTVCGQCVAAFASLLAATVRW